MTESASQHAGRERAENDDGGQAGGIDGVNALAMPEDGEVEAGNDTLLQCENHVEGTRRVGVGGDDAVDYQLSFPITPVLAANRPQLLIDTDSLDTHFSTFQFTPFSFDASPIATTPLLSPSLSSYVIAELAALPSALPDFESATSHSLDLIDFRSSPPSPVVDLRDQTVIELEAHSDNIEGADDDEAEEEEEGDEEEEEDPDTHPLYKLISTSSLPLLQSTWSNSQMILVPPRRTLPDFLPLLSLEATTVPSPTPAASPSTSKSFEFIRGSRGDSPKMERLRTSTITVAKKGGDTLEQATTDALMRYVMLHAFRVTRTAGMEVWMSIGANEAGGRVQVKLERGRSAHIEFVFPPSSTTTVRSSVNENDLPISLSPASPLSTALPYPCTDASTPSSLQPSSSASASASAAPLVATSTRILSSARGLQIVSESTIYRRVPILPLTSTAPPALNRPPKRTALPKWLRRGSSKDVPLTINPAKTTPILDKVRVILVDGEIVEHLSSMAASNGRLRSRVPSSTSLQTAAPNTSSRRLRRGGSGASSVHSKESSKGSRDGSSHGHEGRDGGESSRVPLDRNFISDIFFLASAPSTCPPTLAASALSTLAYLQSLTRDFESSFSYIKGFDVYTVQRIRRGILEKSWKQVSREIPQDEHRIWIQLLENVTLGLLHRKLYLDSILPLFQSENRAFNRILSTYDAYSLLTPALLGVEVCDLATGSSLEGAVATLRKLGSRYSMDSLPEGFIERFGLQPTLVASYDRLDRLLEARPPLTVITIMREAIRGSLAAVEEILPGSRVTPDDLIPLLAFVIVRSQVMDLESLMHFVKTYRLSDGLASELDWSFVTFSASIAYLRSDPLSLIELTSVNIDTVSTSAALSSHRRASELPSFRPRPNSFHSYPSPEFTAAFTPRPASPSFFRSNTLATSTRSISSPTSSYRPNLPAVTKGVGLGMLAPQSRERRLSLGGAFGSPLTLLAAMKSNAVGAVLNNESVEVGSSENRNAPDGGAGAPTQRANASLDGLQRSYTLPSPTSLSTLTRHQSFDDPPSPSLSLAPAITLQTENLTNKSTRLERSTRRRPLSMSLSFPRPSSPLAYSSQSDWLALTVGDRTSSVEGDGNQGGGSFAGLNDDQMLEANRRSSFLRMSAGSDIIADSPSDSGGAALAGGLGDTSRLSSTSWRDRWNWISISTATTSKASLSMPRSQSLPIDRAGSSAAKLSAILAARTDSTTISRAGCVSSISGIVLSSPLTVPVPILIPSSAFSSLVRAVH